MTVEVHYMEWAPGVCCLSEGATQHFQRRWTQHHQLDLATGRIQSL
jgi:hypothetical protein